MITKRETVIVTGDAPPLVDDATLRADTVLLELFAGVDRRRDPYPLLDELREVAPVHHSANGDVWVLTRHADCLAALRDARLGKGNASAADIFSAPGMAHRGVPRVMKSRALVFLNPPDHTRLRQLVSRAFTPRRVDELAPVIDRELGHLIDQAPEGEPFDVLDALAFPLPVAVIGELVGVPLADRAQFRQMVLDGAGALEPAASEGDIVRAERAARDMAVYFGELINERKRHPRDDLVSALLAARDGDDRLTRREVMVTLILLFSAGFETTMNLIGNGLYTLLRFPDELARLRADPALTPSAVEEVLRYESPVQVDGGLVLDDMEVAGAAIRRGSWVLTLLGAANRDPTAYPDPHRFDVGRASDQPLLSFSAGIHYCLGASLARLEGSAVLSRFIERFGSIELAETPRWRDRLVIRGLESLVISVRRS
jgi:cytochrome P450